MLGCKQTENFFHYVSNFTTVPIITIIKMLLAKLH